MIHWTGRLGYTRGCLDHVVDLLQRSICRESQARESELASLRGRGRHPFGLEFRLQAENRLVDIGARPFIANRVLVLVLHLAPASRTSGQISPSHG